MATGTAGERSTSTGVDGFVFRCAEEMGGKKAGISFLGSSCRAVLVPPPGWQGAPRRPLAQLAQRARNLPRSAAHPGANQGVSGGKC